MNIDYVLRNLVTDHCVDMAVRDAAGKGDLVTLVDDACATISPERHALALRAFGGYCRVTDAADVVARLEGMR